MAFTKFKKIRSSGCWQTHQIFSDFPKYIKLSKSFASSNDIKRRRALENQKFHLIFKQSIIVFGRFLVEFGQYHALVVSFYKSSRVIFNIRRQRPSGQYHSLYSMYYKYTNSSFPTNPLSKCLSMSSLWVSISRSSSSSLVSSATEG